MKRFLFLTLIAAILLGGCSRSGSAMPDVAATTLPVYEFTVRLCEGTPITASRIITQSVSCLHDYTLQVSHMRILEGARVIAISGAGLEDFLEDVMPSDKTVIDASCGISLIEEEHGGADGHHHSADPHIWLSPVCAKQMARNLSDGLCRAFPEESDAIKKNLSALEADLDALQAYGEETLSDLQVRELITFHDGFSYFAEAFGLHILRAMEEESGSEVSASELKDLIGLINERSLPAVFTEKNGSTASASVISAETGANVYALDMVLSDTGYWEAMYQNIDTIKEALG